MTHMSSSPTAAADPAAVTAALDEALSSLPSEDGAPVPRDAALAAFRRHLARIQNEVREAFERGEMSGMAAARHLAALTDGLIAALYRYALSLQCRPPCPAGPGWGWSGWGWPPPAATAAACWRRSAISTCCS